MSADLSPDTKAATAQALYDALGAGDGEALTALLHPEFVGHAADGLPLGMGGIHVGPDAMRDNLWWRIGEHFKARAVAHEFQVLDDGQLKVVGTYRGSARRGGHVLDAPFIHLIDFAADASISALRQLTDTAAWCAALGGTERSRTLDYRVEDSVATICLNRPDANNAIDFQMGWDTLRAAQAIAADPTVRAVLICGTGPALTVGGDISYFLDNADRGFGDLFLAMTTPFHHALDILSRVRAPIVTAAHGAVAGGGLGYVYAGDIVVAAEGTKFVTGFAKLGLSGDGGGTWHLPRLIGPRRAASVYLRNQPITAQEALEWGLINEVVSAGDLRSRAAALAAELAHGPTAGFAAMRTLLRESCHNDLSTQLVAETRGLQLTGDSVDARGAIAAFAAKRTPTYTGR
jgi:2-(1,2-epoxy-1,2-dihydrophenyl)acetyl-CoA isomerase